MVEYKRHYLSDSDTIYVNRYERGELNTKLLNRWQRMTVAEAKSYGAFDTANGTMVVHARFVAQGPAIENNTINGIPVFADSKGRLYKDCNPQIGILAY